MYRNISSFDTNEIHEFRLVPNIDVNVIAVEKVLIIIEIGLTTELVNVTTQFL